MFGFVLNVGKLRDPQVSRRERVCRGRAHVARRQVRASAAAGGGVKKWMAGEDGKVELANPFGIVTRDVQELPPRSLMAAEKDEVDQQRLEELTGVITDVNAKSSDMLNAVSEMRFFPPKLVMGPLLQCLRTTPDELTRSQILWTLALFREGDDDCWNAILTELEDLSSPTVSSAAAGALGHMRDSAAVEPLQKAYLASEDFVVQMSAIVSLGEIGDRSVLPQLIKWLATFKPTELNRDSLIVQSLVGAIGDLGGDEAMEALLEWTRNPEPLVRQQTAEALMRAGVRDPRVEQALEAMAGDPEKVVNFTAVALLDQYRSSG